MPEHIKLSAEHGHLVTTNVYDADLNLVMGIIAPSPGWQFNGHRTDCRCETCRPDILRVEDRP
jgi:hypothetical protein